LVSNKLKVKSHSVQIYSSFEAVSIQISNCSFTWLLPMSLSSSWTNFILLCWLSWFTRKLHSEFFILGDFNLHLDIQSTATSTFNDILASFDLKQHVSFATTIHGHWLDFLITRSTTDYIHTLTATDGLSDHFTVIAEIKFKHNSVDSKCNSLYRYTHDIDILLFNDDIVKHELITNPKADLLQLCEQYYTTLKTLLEKQAPIRSKSIKN